MEKTTKPEVKSATIEEYLKRSDELAQNVVDAWGVNMQAGNGELLSNDFKALFDKACTYRLAKRLADNYRENGVPTEQVAAEEIAARQAFAETYKHDWERRHHAA
jgi:hypothetical protein